MRLLTKTTLYFLAVLAPLLIIAGIYLYYQFSKELNHRMDQELITEEVQWIQYLRAQAATGTRFYLRTPEILITPVNENPTKYPVLETTSGADAKANITVLFRQLTHVVSIGGVPYLITLRRSLEQRAVLIKNITRIMLIVFVTFFIITLLLNWLISQSIWQPFRKSLQKINDADLQKMGSLHFEETGIKEFNEMNTSLNRMTEKIHNDYVSIKEFTENAAHEMQTPVAVVQSKLELLLQNDNLREDQMEAIIQSAEALNRLSKLNQSLLLLAKIENNQFATDEKINLTDITKKYLKLFNEFIRHKELFVEEEYMEDWFLNLHPILADTLVSNLVGNAIKYNNKGGKIWIQVRKNKYLISNTSDVPPIDPQQLFKRFYKSNVTPDNTTGLGLAIVKKICDTNSLKIDYHAEKDIHHFTIKEEY